MVLGTVRPLSVCLCLLLWTVNCLDSGPVSLHKRSDDLGPVDRAVALQAQKLSGLEAELQTAKNSFDTELQAAKNSFDTELQAAKAELTAARNTISGLQNELDSVKASQGSTFVRWGRSSCPTNTTMLYSGVAGGSIVGQTGGSTNRLCLTKEPVFDNTGYESAHGQLDGAEYYIPGHLHTDVMCAVCRTSFSDTFMMPGTNRCPAGSSMQYQGHLTAHHVSYAAASEYQCLDASPEDRLGSRGSQDSAYFEYVVSHCGSLPCPPYVNSKVVTCAVCSL